jgi:RNA-directed DNA polymerase
VQRILLDNHFLLDDLDGRSAPSSSTTIMSTITRGATTLTPADIYFGTAATILAERQRIKRDTMANRRLQHRLQAA